MTALPLLPTDFGLTFLKSGQLFSVLSYLSFKNVLIASNPLWNGQNKYMNIWKWNFPIKILGAYYIIDFNPRICNWSFLNN